MHHFKFIILLFFLLLPVNVYAANYTIATGTSTFNGATDCGGACTSADTITIANGARGSLTLQDINGGAAYIPIQNDAVARVILTGRITIDNCKYIDLKGNGLAGTTYGIKIINDTNVSGAVKIQGQSDHVKVSYIEIDDQCTANNTSGIFIQDSTEANTWTWDTIEIHHNYIYGTRYAGMYIGENAPLTEDDPYIANVSIHDNILEDLGSYGMTLKGIKSTSGTCSIYNNTIKNTGLVYVDATNSAHSGISVGQDTYGAVTVNVYNNWVENTKGAGIRCSGVTSAGNDFNIYDNIVLKAGTGNTADYGNGIVLLLNAENVEIYDNIIIQPTRYGIYSQDGAGSGNTMSRNLIGDAGDGYGEWSQEDAGHLTESASPNANIYYANVASFAFDTWSDDSNYANDIFGGRSLNPTTGATGVGTSVTLTGTLFTGVSTVDMYYECGDTSPDVLVVDDGAAISYDPTPDPAESTTCYWQTIYTHGWGTETGAIYSFSTTDVIPPTTGLAPIEIDSGGAPIIINSGGTPIVVGE